MSFAHWINTLFGRHLLPTAEERVAIRAQWRDAVHDHRGETTKLIGLAVHSRRNSAEAIGALQRVAQGQPASVSSDVDLEQLRSLRAWLLARGDGITSLTNEVVDRTRR